MEASFLKEIVNDVMSCCCALDLFTQTPDSADIFLPDISPSRSDIQKRQDDHS